MGGAWERLVRSVKGSLMTIIKDRVLTDYQPTKVFTEIEDLINNRPLTASSDDYNDYEALAPNYFYYYNRNLYAADSEIIRAWGGKC